MWCVERVETCRKVPGKNGADRPNMRCVKARVRSLFRVHFAAFVNFLPFLDCGLRLHAQLSVRTAPIFGLCRRWCDAFQKYRMWPRAPGTPKNAFRPNSEVAVLIKKQGEVDTRRQHPDIGRCNSFFCPSLLRRKYIATVRFEATNRPIYKKRSV